MNRPEINVTPLIDVLLVLLIIFMIVTPMKPSSLEAKVPAHPRTDAAVDPAPLSLVVTVESDGELRLNTQRMGATVDAPGALTERLREIFSEREQNGVLATLSTPALGKTVFIKGRSGLDYGSIAMVVDAVKSSGAATVGLQIDGLSE
jgi:biopolymer transport protein TolR